MQTRYAVKNAKTGKLFSGFDCDNNVIWGDENNAKSFPTKLEAQAQANLFKAVGVSAQLKPQII